MSTEIIEAPARTPMDLISLALEKNLDPDRLEKLMNLQREWQKDQAAREYAEALVGFQREVRPIPKGGEGGELVTKGGEVIAFYGLDRLMQHIGPVMAKFGISATWEIDHAEPATKEHSASLSGSCRIRVGGYYEDRKFVNVPIPPLNLSNTQAYGAAMSYFKRYTLEASLPGIVRIGQDDERALASQGDPPDMSAIDADQLNTLHGLLKGKSDRAIATVLQWASKRCGQGIDSLDQMPKCVFEAAVAQIRSQQKGGGQ